MTTAASIAIAALLAGPAHVAPQASGAEPSFVLACTLIARDTTEADLVRTFGPDNVFAEPVFGFDDGPQQGTVLFAKRSDARVEILWHDPTTKRRPSLVMVRGPVSRWRAPNGIALGDDVAALEKANGRPFRLAGLQVEGHAGAVLSWAGGRLDIPRSVGCRNGVYLQPAYDGTEALALMRQVRSGREYSSGHPAFRALNLRVVLLTLIFDEQLVASTTCPDYDRVAYSEIRQDGPGTIHVENLPRGSPVRRETGESDLKRSPHGTASYTLQAADTTTPGPWSRVMEVSGNAARPIHLRIRFSDPHQGNVRAEWLNEQLLWLQVWRGRIVSTDAILNVETGRFIYEQDANYNSLIVPCSMKPGVPK